MANESSEWIMDLFLGEDADGNTVFRDEQILSTDLKRRTGFGKESET